MTLQDLKRLRVHGVIKRVAHCYKYYLTELGRRAVLTGLKLRELFVIPRLAAPADTRYLTPDSQRDSEDFCRIWRRLRR